MRAPTRGEKFRFRPVLWAHGPKSSSTPLTVRSGGDSPPPRNSTTVSPGIALISLPDTPAGHACVAVDAGHAGCCTAATLSFIAARSTEPRRCRVRSPHPSR